MIIREATFSEYEGRTVVTVDSAITIDTALSCGNGSDWTGEGVRRQWGAEGGQQ